MVMKWAGSIRQDSLRDMCNTRNLTPRLQGLVFVCSGFGSSEGDSVHEPLDDCRITHHTLLYDFCVSLGFLLVPAQRRSPQVL